MLGAIEPCRPNSFEFVSAIAHVFSVPFFSIYVTAQCRQQCPSCTPCQECKAQQTQQILFRGVMTPSLMPVEPVCVMCWVRVRTSFVMVGDPHTGRTCMTFRTNATRWRKLSRTPCPRPMNSMTCRQTDERICNMIDERVGKAHEGIATKLSRQNENKNEHKVTKMSPS